MSYAHVVGYIEIYGKAERMITLRTCQCTMGLLGFSIISFQCLSSSPFRLQPSNTFPIGSDDPIRSQSATRSSRLTLWSSPDKHAASVDVFMVCCCCCCLFIFITTMQMLVLLMLLVVVLTGRMQIHRMRTHSQKQKENKEKKTSVSLFHALMSEFQT